MKKVIDFCKQRYKMLIPVMVVFVLLITVYFLYREYKYDNYRNKKEETVYQYFGGVKNEYTAIITYNLKNVIVDIKPKNKKIEYDATPIYYDDQNKILFPSEMNMVFPLKDGSQYKLYKYSIYEKIDNTDMITMNNKSDYYYHFFLFDGKGLYFFPEEVTLYVNNKEYRKLSSMSYVSMVGGYTLTYYDKEKDTSEVLEVEGKKVLVSSDNMHLNINLNERNFTVYDKQVLLFAPYNLNALSIDK